MNSIPPPAAASSPPLPSSFPPPPAAAVFLTPLQLAQTLGISRRTLSNWTRRGLLPMIKIGKTCRFDYTEVRSALNAHLQPGAAASTDTSSPDGARANAATSTPSHR